MIKKEIYILLMILLLGSISASYPGDTITFECNYSNPVYTIVGNSTIQEFNFTQVNGNISFTIPYDIIPDKFYIVFIDNLTKEVIKEIQVSNGGHSHYFNKNLNKTKIELNVSSKLNNSCSINNSCSYSENNSINPIEKTQKNYLWFIILIVLAIIFIIFIMLIIRKIKKKIC
jgi:ATP-dependent Zn protease